MVDYFRLSVVVVASSWSLIVIPSPTLASLLVFVGTTSIFWGGVCMPSGHLRECDLSQTLPEY